MRLLATLTLIDIDDIEQQRDACIFTVATRIIAAMATGTVGKMTQSIY